MSHEELALQLAGGEELLGIARANGEFKCPFPALLGYEDPTSVRLVGRSEVHAAHVLVVWSNEAATACTSPQGTCGPRSDHGSRGVDEATKSPAPVRRVGAQQAPHRSRRTMKIGCRLEAGHTHLSEASRDKKGHVWSDRAHHMDVPHRCTDNDVRRLVGGSGQGHELLSFQWNQTAFQVPRPPPVTGHHQ